MFTQFDEDLVLINTFFRIESVTAKMLWAVFLLSFF